jgi:hypothetical protein
MMKRCPSCGHSEEDHEEAVVRAVRVGGVTGSVGVSEAPSLAEGFWCNSCCIFEEIDFEDEEEEDDDE